jgi:hypothetical protein
MGYKKDKEDRLSQLSFETPAFQDMILGRGIRIESPEWQLAE